MGINVGQIMRSEANIRVSKQAVEEIEERAKDMIVRWVREAEEYAKRDGRRTILIEHVLDVFDKGKH